MPRSLLLVGLLFSGTAQLAAQTARPPEFSGFASVYLQVAGPGDVPPIAMAGIDLAALHLEGRYNYEDTEAFSLWVGWNLRAGKSVQVLFTPMGGAYVGQGGGAGPGFEFTLTWKKLTVYDESELIFPYSGDSSWIYTWATASWAVRRWFQPGVSIQRLWIPGGSDTVDPGVGLAAGVGPIVADIYAYNPFNDRRSWQLGVSWYY